MRCIQYFRVLVWDDERKKWVEVGQKDYKKYAEWSAEMWEEAGFKARAEEVRCEIGV